jgi:hypothetical protein
MLSRTSLIRIVSVLVAAAPVVAIVACGGATPPPHELPTSSDPAFKDISPADLEALGCDDPFVVCVNACTGRLVRSERIPLVAGTQQVVVRTVGWGSCRPDTVTCTSHDVKDNDVEYRSVPPAPLDDAGVAVSPAVESAAAALGPAGGGTDAAAQVTALTEAKDYSTHGRTKDPKLERTIQTAELALAHDNRLGVSTLLTTVAAKATLAPSTPDAAAPAPTTTSNQKPSSASSVPSSDAPTLTLAATPDACAAAAIAATRAATDASTNLATIKAGAQKLGTAQTAQLDSDIDDAQSRLTAYKSLAGAICTDPSKTPQETLAAATAAITAMKAVRRDVRRLQTDFVANAEAGRVESFVDCVITVPSDLTTRQAVVDVKIFAPERPSGAPSSGDDADGGAGDAQPPSRGDGGSRPSKDALVYIDINHGKYYYDVGVLTAFVPLGQRTISTPQRPGIPGDYMIALNESGTTLTGVALNLYPFGRRRQSYSPFEGKFELKSALGEMFGIQVAFDPNLKDPVSTLFGGVLVEPVTGLSLNFGAVLLQGDFLQSGYALGMSPTSNRSDFVVQKAMVRAYFGFTLGFELIHTTAARLPATTND